MLQLSEDAVDADDELEAQKSEDETTCQQPDTQGTQRPANKKKNKKKKKKSGKQDSAQGDHLQDNKEVC